VRTHLVIPATTPPKVAERLFDRFADARPARVVLTRLDEALKPRVARLTLRLPYADGPALAACYERGRVLSRRDEPDGIRLEVELPRRLLASLERYRIRD